MGVDKMTDVCYEVVTDQPIKESFSLFVTQICLIFIISKLIDIVGKLLRLPRFIPDILVTNYVYALLCNCMHEYFYVCLFYFNYCMTKQRVLNFRRPVFLYQS